MSSKTYYKALCGLVCCCRVYTIQKFRYQSFPVHVCCLLSKVSLICWLISSDVSVGAAYFSRGWEILVVDLATLESVSFSLGKNLIGV